MPATISYLQLDTPGKITLPPIRCSLSLQPTGKPRHWQMSMASSSNDDSSCFTPIRWFVYPFIIHTVLYTNNRRSSVQDCNTSFSGKYSKGNLARHYKANHCGKGEGMCPAPNCSRTYRRGDALLKHYRNAHMDLGMEFLYTQRRRFLSEV